MISNGGLKWQYFPKSNQYPSAIEETLEVFLTHHVEFDSDTHEVQHSNEVLEKLRNGLEQMGYEVESDKSAQGKVKVPVLFGSEGKIAKAFEADAWHKSQGVVLEVEAGRAYANNQFLKDLFQACVMQNVDYLIIAVRKTYKKTPDYLKICDFIETLYVSEKLTLPLKGILIIGY